MTARSYRHLLGTACLATLAIVAFLGTGAPTAGAAEGECPNEAIRIEQDSTHLPDCRAWEMVSLADKDRNPILGAALSADGNRVLYNTEGPVPGTPSGAHATQIAQRTKAGWLSHNILPAQLEMPGRNYLLSAVSPNLDSIAVSIIDGLDSSVTAEKISLAVLDGLGGQRLLHTFPTYFGSSGLNAVASDDLRHIYINVPRGIDPSLASYSAADVGASSPGNIFDFGSGSPVLASAMPETNQPPTCGVITDTGAYNFAVSGDPQSLHWISSDGSRVFFVTRGDDATNGCAAPLHLYVRAVGPGSTKLISGPPISGDPDNGIDRFLQATPNAGAVFYRSATSLDSTDDTDANSSDLDIYRYTAADGNVCITCGISGLEVLGGQFNTSSVIAQDGSRVYFDALGQHDGASEPGSVSAPNTYVWRAQDESVHFVARTSGLTPKTQVGGYLTPDGATLLFLSAEPSLNGTGSDNGGHEQYYRYDDEDQQLSCISCPLTGPATHSVEFSASQGVGPIFSPSRPMSDNGQIIFFTAYDPLVLQDSNESPDIYEWHDGTRSLITDGRTHRDGGTEIPVVLSTSSSGRDVLFRDAARLTFDAQDTSMKYYSARIDGGFRGPAPPPTPCQEQQCVGPPSPEPSALLGGSDTTADPGNLRQKRRKHKKVNHKHKKVSHKRNRPRKSKRITNGNRGGVK